jgi:hypothetical protein
MTGSPIPDFSILNKLSSIFVLEKLSVKLAAAPAPQLTQFSSNP